MCTKKKRAGKNVSAVRAAAHAAPKRAAPAARAAVHKNDKIKDGCLSRPPKFDQKSNDWEVGFFLQNSTCG